VDFRQFMFHGDPFNNFQCLQVFNQEYGDIRFAKFNRNPQNQMADWCTQGDLSNALYIESFKRFVQETAGKPAGQILLKFKIPEDVAEDASQLVFNPNIMLVVTYLPAE